MNSTHVFVPEVLLRDTLYLLGSDRIDSVLDLPWRESLAARHKLPPDVLRDRRRAVEAEEQARLELALRALNLTRGRRDAHAGPLAECEVQQIVQVGEVLRDEVDAPQARVGVGRREGHVRVGEVVLRDCVREPRGE